MFGLLFINNMAAPYQVKFCYLINDIERGPRYIATKSIQRANALIADLEAEGSK